MTIIVKTKHSTYEMTTKEDGKTYFKRNGKGGGEIVFLEQPITVGHCIRMKIRISGGNDQSGVGKITSSPVQKIIILQT